MDATPAVQRMGEPEEPHGHTEPTPHHAVNYYAIFITLIVLTVVTVAVAFVHIKSELTKVLIALLIASVKALFVARFFMHLKFEGKLIRLILISPLVLCVILVMALIPDIANGRHVSMNDMMHWFEKGHPRDAEAGKAPMPGGTGGTTAKGETSPDEPSK
jgi:cytochrome c oxidase subunit 4